MAILFGLVLLFLLLLGAALFLLALIFLAISVGLQLFGVAAGVAWVPTLATSVQLAAGSAFALGVILIAIGLTAFLSPAVRAFLKGLVLLVRLALSPAFTQLIHRLPQILRQTAALLDGGGRVLIAPQDPANAPDPPDVTNHPLTRVGSSLSDASTQFPEVPAIDFRLVPLWLKFDDHNNYVEGFIQKLPGMPDDAKIVIFMRKDAAATGPVTGALSGLGDVFEDAGRNAVNVGTEMRQTAVTLNQGADLIEQALQ